VATSSQKTQTNDGHGATESSCAARKAYHGSRIDGGSRSQVKDVNNCSFQISYKDKQFRDQIILVFE
jgi:hypothetical protein